MKGASTNNKATFNKGKHPYPKNVNLAGMKSDANAKDDDRWSIAGQRESMRKEAHSNQRDKSNLGFSGYKGSDSQKGE